MTTLDSERVLQMFRQSEALLEGHFRLTSGKHSPQYFQCAKVLQYPEYCEALCGAIAARFRGMNLSGVIAPALGGIVVGQEVGRQLNIRTMFTERADGVMQLRRGFSISPHERFLVCEDVVTTGGSVSEVIDIVRRAGAEVAGVGYIVDRSGGKVAFPVAPGGMQFAVMTLQVVMHEQTECPLCAQGIPVVKPGSRGNA